MSDVKLWGDSQVPDADIIVESFDGTNRNLPMKGIKLGYRLEHFIEIDRCKHGYKNESGIEYFASRFYEITVGVERKLMELWPIQKEALKFFEDNNRVVMNSSRQTSKSTLIRLKILYTLVFSDEQQAMGMLANNFTTAKKSLKELKRAYEALPLFLKPAMRQSNESHFELENNNLIRISASTADALRGDTLTSLIIDEAAFINRNGKDGLDEMIMQSLMPTLDAAKDKSFCILISTPYGRNNTFAKKYFESKDWDGTGDEPVFKHFEMLWSDHPERDEKWLKNKLKEIGQEVFDIEFGGSFDLGSGIKKIIDQDVRDHAEENTIEPPFMTQNWDLSEINDEKDHSLKIWELPQEGHIYVAGCDISEGTGNCYSTVEIFDVTDLYDIRQVAEYENNEILTPEFTLVCLKLFNTYNQCYAGVEANNVGREVLNPLVKSHSYTNLFIIGISPEDTRERVKKKVYGFWSHNNSKRKIVTNSRYFLNTRKCVTIRSLRLLRQLDSFIQHKGKSNNTSWSAENSSVNDDLVDALNVALAGLHEEFIQDYFILEDPKFDNLSKPIKIKQQRLTESNNNKMTININQPTVNISIYTNDMVGVAAEIQKDPMDWLQNF